MKVYIEVTDDPEDSHFSELKEHLSLWLYDEDDDGVKNAEQISNFVVGIAERLVEKGILSLDEVNETLGSSVNGHYPWRMHLIKS